MLPRASSNSSGAITSTIAVNTAPRGNARDRQKRTRTPHAAGNPALIAISRNSRDLCPDKSTRTRVIKTLPGTPFRTRKQVTQWPRVCQVVIRTVITLSRTPSFVSSVVSKAISPVRVGPIRSRRVVATIVMASDTSLGIALSESLPSPHRTRLRNPRTLSNQPESELPNSSRSRDRRSACARRFRGYRIGVLDCERIVVLAVADSDSKPKFQEASI